MNIICKIIGHRWSRFMFFSVARCTRCPMKFRGKAAFKAIYGQDWEKWWNLYELDLNKAGL